MVKNLVNKLMGGTKNKARRFGTALGLSALLLFNGYFSNNCKSPFSPDLTPPTAILSVSPDSGNAPLEVKVKLDGTPRDNIAKYVLKIGSSYSSTGLSGYGIDRPSGIDSGFRRPGEETRRGFGRERTRDNSKIKEQEGVNRGYGIKTSGIERFRTGEKVKIDRIVKEQIRNNEMGYEDYKGGIPETSFWGMNKGLIGNIQSHKTVVLGSYDSPEEILESSYPIDITRVYDNITNEDIRIFFTGEVTDRQGRKSPSVSRIVTVSPREDIYISGILKCNETHSGAQGMLMVFDSNRNLLETNKSDKEGYNLTNASGSFNFQIKRRASELEDIIIRAAHGTPGNPQSWVRTINIPSISQSGISIVAVPYKKFSANPNEFRDFMYEVTYDGNPKIFDYVGFDRGFIIIRENLDDSIDNGKPEGKGKFTDAQVQYIKHIITPGVEKVEKIVGTSNYSIKIKATSTSENYNPGGGVVYIIPSTAPGGNPHCGGLFIPTAGMENLLQGADIYINTMLKTQYDYHIKHTILHEIGHILYGPSTKNQNSVMASPGTNSYSPLDLKGTKIVYEKTYRHDNWRSSTRPLQHLKYILGKDFDNWD